MAHTRSRTEKTKLLRDAMASTRWQVLTDEFQELVRLATPLYVEMLSSVPFYKAWGNDPSSWGNYIGSRINEARDLVARSKKLSR